MKIFTKETLSNYNGKNGRPAYIAFNGTVYDVTNNSRWPNGNNNGLHAGYDLSPTLANFLSKELIPINKVGLYN
ncbi:cytochrome b5 domain-containing protein [uncultured Lactobacillus sp.]|uniref:cytochrome b5 domain-containing protein n=1 Tax=uncultured Lactobacillus sp. TaxID=153152 RepID=UPI002635819E|nr:cytochrome b5 domain-containing protein [uncultured Lactobacillus sp.]